MPTFGRPARTKRALECVFNQDLNGFEFFFIGDCCPDYQNLIESDWFKQRIEKFNKKNKIIYFNLEKNYGGYGYHIINYAVDNCTGEYFMFMGNDDIIKYNHLSNYYNEINKLNKDFMYFNSIVRVGSLYTVRDSKLMLNYCGHSELIIKSSLMKKVGKHHDRYGHDFDLITNLMKETTNHSKGIANPTYQVMGTPRDRELGID